MKARILFLFMCLTFICEFAIAQTYKTYAYNNNNAFSISYPYNWNVMNNPGTGAIVAIIEPEHGYNFMSNFNVVVAKRNVYLEKSNYAHNITKQMQQYFSDFKIISTSYVTINDIKGMKVVASCTMEDFPIKYVQYALRQSDKLTYFVTFCVASNRYDTEQPRISYIIKSFKIK